MKKYLLRRLLMVLPTLFGITIIVFAIINLAPGGPVEQIIQQMKFGGDAGGSAAGGDAGVSQEVIDALKVQYGFDKPMMTRYFIWLKNIFRLDFGDSFTYNEPVIDVIFAKFPVSLQFGLVSFILAYIICIPLGLFMAKKEDSVFDKASIFSLKIMYSIPAFMLGILLIVYFAGGSYFDWFPLGGAYSDDFEDYTAWGQFLDRLHHYILPGICYVIGSFTTLTLLMRNSVLEEIKKDYIRTARAKGLDENKVYFLHALRNALIPIATGIGGFLSVFFAGSILIEQIFQLDGIGLLSYNALLQRDYNVIMGLVFMQSVMLVVGNIISDMAYVLVDPRIDFK